MFLFCKPLETTTKVENVLKFVRDFFEGNCLDLYNLVGVTTNGAPAMLGSQSDLEALVKQHALLANVKTRLI